MFDQIPNESEIMDRFRQGAQERGMFAQIIGIFGIIFVIALIVLGVCVIKGFWMIDTQGANRVLQEQGYKNIQITGYRWFTCDKSDYFHTGFRALGPDGSEVTGTVCRGFLFKANTVRLD